MLRKRVGWEDLLPNLEVVRVPGGYVSLLDEPHIAAVSSRIASRLQAR